MFSFSGFSSSLKKHRKISAVLKESFFHAWDTIRTGDGDNVTEKCRMAGLAVVRRLLDDGTGSIDPRKLELYKRLLESESLVSDIGREIDDLRNAEQLSPAEAALRLAPLPAAGRVRLLRFLLALAAAADCPAADFAMLSHFAGDLEIPLTDYHKLRKEVTEEVIRRRRIISSGAGIAAAVIVVLVFILTATLLKSVIFGLIIAYLLLPIEKFFERRLRAGRGIGHYFFNFVSLICSPLISLSHRVMRRSMQEEGAGEKKLRRERSFIRQAMAQTLLLVSGAVIALIVVFSVCTEHYVSDISLKMRSWQEQRQAAAAAAAAETDDSGENTAEKSSGIGEEVSRIFEQAHDYLDTLQLRFERLPVVQLLLKQMKAMLEDEKTQQELAAFILKRSGGVVSFTAGVLGMLAAVLCDLLLTIFFALLFLMKLAEFCSEDESRSRRREYLVRSVLSSKWLPGANESTIREARRIINGILDRLRIWVRGYLTLVLVDSTVYTTVFFLLKVPYFPILGLLAGCGILLPYIGPIISAAITVLVTLAMGGSSGAQLLAIVTAYLIYNGIIEQFILYPAVIGDSLGLTTLETIIVVLLGAIFAGVPGMLFALPATSILKYLVPQFYRSWNWFRK